MIDKVGNECILDNKKRDIFHSAIDIIINSINEVIKAHQGKSINNTVVYKYIKKSWQHWHLRNKK